MGTNLLFLLAPWWGSRFPQYMDLGLLSFHALEALAWQWDVQEIDDPCTSLLFVALPFVLVRRCCEILFPPGLVSICCEVGFRLSLVRCRQLEDSLRGAAISVSVGVTVGSPFSSVTKTDL